MRSFSHAAMAPAAAFAIAGAVWAAPLSPVLMDGDRAGGVVVRAEDDCEDLRLVCLDRDALGRRGQRNCSRYRHLCGVNRDYCARLLGACMQKDARGPEGKQNCRCYRLECSRA
jgi:hypothetical protein